MADASAGTGCHRSQRQVSEPRTGACSAQAMRPRSDQYRGVGAVMVWVFRMTPCSQRSRHMAREVEIGELPTFGSTSDALGSLRISGPKAAPYGDLLSVQGAPKGGGQNPLTKLQIGGSARRARALCAPNPSHRFSWEPCVPLARAARCTSAKRRSGYRAATFVDPM